MDKVLAAMPRYEAYKDSGVAWLGKVPRNWQIIRLKFVVLEHGGNGFPVELQGNENGDIPFFKVSDISGGAVFTSSAANYVDEPTIKNKKWNTIPSGSVLAAKIGEAIRKNHRKITSEISVIDNNCIAIEPKHIDAKYNYYLHKVIDFEWFINPGTVPSISVSKYRSFFVALPCINEQEIIAAYLDAKTTQIDQAIQVKEKQIALLKERKQILIQNAVTRGLDPSVPMKDSGVDWIGEMPEHWSVVANRSLFCERVEPGQDGLPLLMVSIHSGVSDEEISDEDNVRGRVKIEDKSKYNRVEPGDIVFNMMRAWQGAIGAVRVFGMVSPAYIIARPIGAIDSQYYEYQYRCPVFIQQMDRFSKGITDFRKRLYWDEYKQLVTILPPLDEQAAIVVHIAKESAKIDKAITLQQQQIERLKEYKTTLINSAVTGKIKVA